MAVQQKLEELTAPSFEPYVGTLLPFELPQAGGEALRIELEVAEVRAHLRIAELMDAAQPGSLYSRVPFSVLFRAAAEPPFAQALLRLKHTAFEDCDLLLTRVMAPGRDPSQAWFEAVFG